jgi:hypothetical protein
LYSLVSAPVLGFDLARARGGARVADVVVRALALGSGDLPVLARLYHDDTARLGAWVELTRSGEADPELGPLVAGVTARVADGEPVTNRQLALLETARIGDLGGLLRCLRHDVFDWTWNASSGAPDLRVQQEQVARAVAVVCDAAAAAYAQEQLSTPARRRLAGSWLRGTRELPERVPDLGPQHAAIEALLARVRRVGEADRARLARAVDRSRRGGDWSGAVHAASWAVHLSGRVRAAAAAQLLLVRAVADAGIPVEELAAGAWNLLSGAVQALSVRDVADAGTLHALISPYLEALGPAG